MMYFWGLDDKNQGKQAIYGDFEQNIAKIRDLTDAGAFTRGKKGRAELGSKTKPTKGRAKYGSKKERRALVPLFFDAEGASAIVNDSWAMSDEDDCVLT